jgi:pimeloyl-ACP methyl ester carboxylesterase
MSHEPSTVLLVHGAFGGSWGWELVRPLLDQRGVPSVTVDLPSVGAEPSYSGGLAADAAVVSRVLDETPGPFVVCGHSYGGMVVTEAVAGRSNVTQLVYLCAFLPAAGESLMMLTGGPAPWIQRLDDGRVQVDPVHAQTTGYADCPPEVRDAAVARLRPQVPTPFGDPVSAGRPADVPATYVICTEDRSLPVELQRDVFAPRADEVVELVSGHSPQFSSPQRIADLLAERARR